MITKDQAENALDILYCALPHIDNTDMKAEETLSQYILQMEAIAARYNYLQNAPDSCEPDRVDVVIWTKCDGGNSGDAIRGSDLDDYIDNEISKEMK